jgi:hypothetical protein
VTPIGVMPVALLGRNGLQKLIHTFGVNVKVARKSLYHVAQQ